MGDKAIHIKIPTYSTDKIKLVRITELIIDGKKTIAQIPLQAYQIIHRASDQGTA